MSIISYIRQVIEVIISFNECDTFFQRIRSLQSRWNGTESQELKEDDVRNSLQCLQDTLPAMYNFIDRVEWRSHEDPVAVLLPKLRAAVYDAEDLQEYLRCYEQKVKIEGSVTSAEPGNKLFHDVSHGNFKKLTPIKERLDNLFGLLEKMGLHQVTPRFDRSVRPKTTRFPTEAEIFGRSDEIMELIRLLGVPANNRRGPSRPKRKRNAIPSSSSNQVCATLDNNEATITSVPVLPIFGIGGVGKTTLAQNICSHPQVKKHFDVIVWICVSDDFDVERLTKEALEQFSEKATMKDNLDSLQVDLTYSINKRRFLIVLDDMWAEIGELWKRFCAPFKDVLEGSMMLVTTRSEKVANIVRTMDPFHLEGLKDNVFHDFFQLCVFGSDNSNNSPELESIGEQIVPKLKGSPLAAKTLGRLLGMSFDPTHWNMILNNQLWVHKQEDTEIMPALRLSYIYLPLHLKRCFSFCAVYPKDYNFVKEDLAEIWVAEGFVKADHNIPLQQIGCKYFEELAHLSFFQKFRGKYVMHDLIHDMAQLVSKDNCFIIKEKRDLERIPRNVRHLSVLKSRDFKCSDLESLCKQTKLRTILCDMSLKGQGGDTVMKKWCTELSCTRVMICASVSRFGLPDSISNMKSLRYLKISDACLFDSLPATFCHLYNLEVLSARKCKIKVIPEGFSNLVNLQKFELHVPKIDARKINNLNMFTGDLYLHNLWEISMDRAAKIGLMKKKDPFNLTLDWSKEINFSLGPQVHNGIEVFKALQPSTTIKCVCLICYPGEYLPSWFHGSDVPTILSSLIEITIIDCPRLSSLELFLQPTYMPAIKKMLIKNCTSLVSVPVERFGGLPSIEELEVCNCPKINSQHLLAPSLKKLSLQDSGNLGDDIDCSSLTTFHLSACHLASLTINGEKLPRLADLTIEGCPELDTLNGGRFNGSDDSTIFSSLTEITIINCPRLSSLEQFIQPAYMPAIKKMLIKDCTSLVSIPVERFGGLPSLEELGVCNCPKINSQHLLAPSLKKLSLQDSGNLGDDIDCSSLTTFHLSAYHLASLTVNGEKLPRLTGLTIEGCPELDTLNGGRFNGSDDSTIFSSLTEITIVNCPRLSSLEQFLQPAYMPTIEKMLFKDCTSLVSVPVERFGGLPSLEELEVCNCPKINSQHLLAPSLKKLSLQDSGNLGDDIDCSSLTTFHLSAYHLVSLTVNGEKLTRLSDLTIEDCPELDTLNGGMFNGSGDSAIFSSLTEITIINCPRLSSLEQFLQPAYMPAIKKMLFKDCTSLVSVPVERFGGLPSLEELEVCNCPKINSQHLLAPSLKKLSLQDSGNLGDDIDCSSLTTFYLSAYHLASLTVNGEKLPRLTDLTIEECPELDTLNGAWPILKSLSIIKCPCLKRENRIMLPSSLQNLYLWGCGYFSVRCLENLTSLKTLKMVWGKHIEYIPRDLWSSSLKSLQELSIEYYGDLVSIGGLEAIAHIPKVSIRYCPKLKEVQQPLQRGY